jgi:hypothetical protein
MGEKMSFVKETVVAGKDKLSEEGRKKASEALEQARKKDEKMVKGIFKNLEAPGAEAMFSYRAYKEHPIRTYTLEDGKTYDLPLGVAKHINRQCRYQRCANLIDKDGKPMIGAGDPVQRYEFTPTDYM